MVDREYLLDIATTEYYYKPFAAFFGAFTLNAYSRLIPTLDRDTLDIGCGDGTFDNMLLNMMAIMLCH